MPRRKKQQPTTEPSPSIATTDHRLPIQPEVFDRKADFTGWDWNKLPHWVTKAARQGSVTSNIITAKVECIECKRDMWTVNAKLEDMCEECEWHSREAVRKNTRIKANRRVNGSYNPFSDEGSQYHGFWPTDKE